MKPFFYVGVISYYEVSLLVDFRVKFELQLLLVVYFARVFPTLPCYWLVQNEQAIISTNT